MNIQDRIDKLKTELREFIQQSKAITPGKWAPGDEGDIVYRQPGNVGHLAGIIVHGRASGVTREQDSRDAAFIARSRNISPALAEGWLIALEALQQVAFVDNHKPLPADRDLSFNGCNAYAGIQQILTIWEAAK